jgi:hypothetical protein
MALEALARSTARARETVAMLQKVEDDVDEWDVAIAVQKARAGTPLNPHGRG